MFLAHPHPQAAAEAAALQAQIDSAVVDKQEEQAAQVRPPTGSANNNSSQEESQEEEGEDGGGAVASALAELHVVSLCTRTFLSILHLSHSLIRA